MRRCAKAGRLSRAGRYSDLNSAATFRLGLMLLEMLRVAGLAAASHEGAASAATLGADGKPREELFEKDRLHFNAEGYRILTSIVRSHLK